MMKWHRFGGSPGMKPASKIVHAVLPDAQQALCRVGRKAYNGARSQIGDEGKKGDIMCANCIEAARKKGILHELKTNPNGFRLGNGKRAKAEAKRRRDEIKNLERNHTEESP